MRVSIRSVAVFKCGITPLSSFSKETNGHETYEWCHKHVEIIPDAAHPSLGKATEPYTLKL